MSTLISADNMDGSLKIADGYSQAAQILMKSAGQTRRSEFLHSMVVLRALSLDIYMRCLYALDRNKAYEGHHVKQVFAALSDETRRKVTEYYDRSVAESEFIQQTHSKHMEIKGAAAALDLEHVLQEWGDALKGRYFFAPEHKISFLAYAELEKALVQRIEEIRSSAGGEQKSAA